MQNIKCFIVNVVYLVAIERTQIQYTETNEIQTNMSIFVLNRLIICFIKKQIFKFENIENMFIYRNN